MSRPLREIAEHALTAARRAGAREVATRAGRTRYTSVTTRERRVEKIESSTTSGLTLSLFLDGRYSSSSTNGLRAESVEVFIERLAAMTRMLAPDEHRGLADPEHYAGRVERDLGIYAEDHAALDMDQRTAYARAVEDAALASDARVISATATCSDSVSESVRLHSNGFLGARRSSHCSAHADVAVRGAGEKKPSDWWYRSSRRFADLGDPASIGRTAAQRAVAAIGAAKIASARLPLVVENRAAARLVSLLLGPLSAASLQQQRSCLADKLGAAITSDLLTLIDDPFVPGGLGSRLFDGEGITARRRTVIEGGVLRSYFVDVYYGRKLGLAATSGSRSNLLFEGGVGDRDALLRCIERGVFVTSFLGGNSNTATGDFSLGVRGRLIENGALTAPVAEMNITDNLIPFWLRLRAVGADAYLHSATRSPTLCFDDVQFSGS